jgi:hypothetical protein
VPYGALKKIRVPSNGPPLTQIRTLKIRGWYVAGGVDGDGCIAVNMVTSVWAVGEPV